MLDLPNPFASPKSPYDRSRPLYSDSFMVDGDARIIDTAKGVGERDVCGFMSESGAAGLNFRDEDTGEDSPVPVNSRILPRVQKFLRDMRTRLELLPTTQEPRGTTEWRFFVTIDPVSDAVHERVALAGTVLASGEARVTAVNLARGRRIDVPVDAVVLARMERMLSEMSAIMRHLRDSEIERIVTRERAARPQEAEAPRGVGARVEYAGPIADFAELFGSATGEIVSDAGEMFVDVRWDHSIQTAMLRHDLRKAGTDR